MKMPNLQPGDRVTWSFNAPVGYGYVIPVAAVVLYLTASRARIAVARKINGEWVREEKTVSREKLTPRLVAVEALGSVN